MLVVHHVLMVSASNATLVPLLVAADMDTSSSRRAASRLHIDLIHVALSNVASAAASTTKQDL
jgi:hypothetical protein